MSAYVIFLCDICGREAEEPVAFSRAPVLPQGWTSDGPDHLCPRCKGHL